MYSEIYLNSTKLSRWTLNFLISLPTSTKKKRKTSKKYLSYNEREQWLNEMVSTFGRITTH